ncbi:kinesin-like protein KIN-13A [Iris pallida]|uniref:Kinesin-like protein KIN-13A n=1 Tax=Iris pallida TaxID=29817 RepID=A0AAX6FVB6_IRIPA|nr:kinesin-like protein KIN-13A [Iris pallida]
MSRSMSSVLMLSWMRMSAMMRYIMRLWSLLYQQYFSKQKQHVLRMVRQVVAKHIRCNLYLSELQTTLFGGCGNQSIEIRSLNCGLAILRFMVGSFMIFLVIGGNFA